MLTWMLDLSWTSIPWEDPVGLGNLCIFGGTQLPVSIQLRVIVEYSVGGCSSHARCLEEAIPPMSPQLRL
jgi:hypothetical protein